MVAFVKINKGCNSVCQAEEKDTNTNQEVEIQEEESNVNIPEEVQEYIEDNKIQELDDKKSMFQKYHSSFFYQTERIYQIINPGFPPIQKPADHTLPLYSVWFIS